MDQTRRRTCSFDTETWRRIRVEHALHAVEEALALLTPSPADGIEIRALERLRDDLAVLLRATAPEPQ
jgi:hypothetical protein